MLTQKQNEQALKAQKVLNLKKVWKYLYDHHDNPKHDIQARDALHDILNIGFTVENNRTDLVEVSGFISNHIVEIADYYYNNLMPSMHRLAKRCPDIADELLAVNWIEELGIAKREYYIKGE